MAGQGSARLTGKDVRRSLDKALSAGGSSPRPLRVVGRSFGHVVVDPLTGKPGGALDDTLD